MKYCLLLLFSVNFLALADSEYFEVDGIEVKQKSNNSLTAKHIALSVVIRAAFEKLLKTKLNVDLSVANRISNQQIQSCIYDYSIDREKFSDLLYIGEFSYRFSKKRVARLLKQYGVNIDVGSETKVARIAVYLNDFIIHAKELAKLKIVVEKFSNEKVLFGINRKFVSDFRKLRIKYGKSAW